MCIMMLSFLSSKRYGLDRVAAKHVVLSFRFVVIVVLLATDVTVSVLRVYKFGRHPTLSVANALAGLVFSMCMLLDCSPHLPASAQIFLSVISLNIAF
jgi:hypothetical protein